MKKQLFAMALASLCFAAQHASAITLNITGNRVQDESGNNLPAGSTVMLIVSTGDSDFGNLESPSSASDTAFANEADDVVLFRWGFDENDGPGSTVQSFSFNLGDFGTASGDPLILVWYSGLSENTNPTSPGQGRRFGTFRDGSWAVPGDNSAQLDLTMLTTAAGGSLNDSEGLADQITFAPAANIPPTAVCQDVTVDANANCEANVTAAQVDNGSSDSDGSIVDSFLTPAGPYPLGDTAVTLSVVDDDGATNSCAATITVEDNTAPSITCPSNIAVTSSNACEVVNYTVPTATDNCDADPTEACVPPSGHCFPVGSTTVNCTATDSASNVGTCSFTVTVTGPGPTGCIGAIQASNLNANRQNSLIKRLQKAEEKFNEGKTKQGCAQLRAFLIKLNVYERVGLIDPADAAAIRACVQAQQSANGCL